VTLKLQQAFMAFVAEKQATPAFAAWKKAKADAKAKAKDAKKASLSASEGSPARRRLAHPIRSPSARPPSSLRQEKTHNLHLAYATELRTKDTAAYKAWETAWLEKQKAAAV